MKRFANRYYVDTTLDDGRKVELAFNYEPTPEDIERAKAKLEVPVDVVAEETLEDVTAERDALIEKVAVLEAEKVALEKEVAKLDVKEVTR